MFPVQCDQLGHQDFPISALCLRQDCKINSSICARCVKLHRDCTDHLKFLDEVPEAISQLKALRDWFRDSFDQIKQLIAKLEKMVNQHFLSIDEYANSSTLTNLNRLGQMLRDSKPYIQVLEQQKQMICQNLDRFKDMLSNREVSQIPQSDPVELSQEEKDLVEKYYDEGEGLYGKSKYLEAIVCFDKALKIDKEHFYSLFWKGRFQIFLGHSLYLLNIYQESIDCFDQCIKIDPQKYNSYYLKGRSLQSMNKHQEAIKCFDESIQLKPDDMTSYQYKGESLEALSRLEHAEQCYKEGVKHIPNSATLKLCLSSVQEQLKKQK